MSRAAGLAADGATTEPATQPWAAKPPDQWPQIVLRNHITLKGFGPWQGVCAFLMKLPTGQVVGVTIFGELVQGVNLADTKGSVAEWNLAPPTRPGRSVALRQLAMPPDSCHSMNCVMMTTPPSLSHPVEVLLPSPTKAHVGQAVFLVGVSPDGNKTAQVIYPGTIVALDHPTPGLIAYRYQAHAPPDSFGGGPLLDARGHVIGLHQSWYPEGTSGDVILGQALQITTAIAAVNLPPDPEAAAAFRDSRSAALAATTRPSAAPIDPAQAELRTARAYLSSKMYEPARAKLLDIIQKYPNTPAAKDAQVDLDSIPESDANP